MMNQKDQWSDEIRVTGTSKLYGKPIDENGTITIKFDSQKCDDCKIQHEILNPTDIGCQ